MDETKPDRPSQQPSKAEKSGRLNRLTQFLTEFISTVASKNKLIAHLRTPLFRNAYYLMASTATFGLGSFAFWAIAARFYSEEDVGLASAAISAISLIAVISGLGLGFGLIRFLPNAGEKSTQMINACLTIGGSTSIVVGTIFLAGLGFWSPALTFIRERPIYIACFLVVAAGWTLFSLTEQVFVAKRNAKFTFTQNIAAATVKVLLLILFASFFGAFGIFSSAGLGMTAGLGVALFCLVPRVQRGYLPFPSLQRGVVNAMMHYSLGNYFAGLLWLLPGLLFPLMVVNILGAELNAYFYIAWAIAGMILMVPAALSSSLFAEGSYEEGRLLIDTKRSLKMNLIILVLMIVLVFAFGSRLLLLFGEAYSENATRLLWVLAISAIPMSVNNLYLTVMRVRKNIPRLIVVSAATTCLTLGLSYPLMLKFGILGVGMGWIAGQSIVAATIILPLLSRRLRA